MSEIYSKSSFYGYSWFMEAEGHDYLFNSFPVNSASDSNGKMNSVTGSYLPGWKSIIRSGGNATTNLNGIEFLIEGDTFFSYQRFGHYPAYGYAVTYQCSGHYPYNWVNSAIEASPSLKAEVKNRAIRKFLDDAKSKRTSFEAGQDLGEIKQTIESFVHPMKSLRDLTLGYFQKLKKAKGKYRDSISLHKALSDSYLEYRFGWRPLALDIADAYAGLTSRTRMSNTAPCSASGKGSEKLDSSSGLASYGWDSRMVLDQNSYLNYSFRIKGAIRLNLDSNGRIPLAQSLQLSTVNDFAVTAWDLLPYSFVVDYFVNVGEIVNALTFPTSDLTYVVATERTELISQYLLRHITVDSTPGLVWDSQGTNASSVKFIVKKFSRYIPDSLDLIPSVRVSLPVSSRPWENMGALISSNTKSLVPFFK
ncbi:maturation protein [ssRNA phage Esthiorhiza.2_46]|jgi:hypothetical protein|uniref:Maturation protein n=2 Tax=Norzivirales TaxID=2842247 RepID=A0A8S5KYK0_9VIRU|nr:maturation protein [ssRNA phage Esthiorhiza.2_46]QDH89003.1 MAG: hypothetical protein H2RhizoLitter7280_000002 [Leviviridae sp.]DAD49962.1 TPA_asm: maturation protein [ssRNA phage Esthiorhiza.2_46]